MIDEIKNVLVVGRGHVGDALGRHILNNGFNMKWLDPLKNNFHKAIGDFDPELIHITIPFYMNESYLVQCGMIINEYDAEIIVVNSTIIPSTIELLCQMYPHKSIIYSPMRYNDAKMFEEMTEIKTLYAICNSSPIEPLVILMENYYRKLKFPALICFDPKALILGKLLEVVWFGMNIAFAQQAKLICDKLDIDFYEAYTLITRESRIGKDYTECASSDVEYIPRPVFRPGIIGGHCVIPDTELMLKNNIGDSRLWQWILDTNKKIIEKEEKKNG